eukprot:6113670-Alexandrium_andersonii.AAC.1
MGPLTVWPTQCALAQFQADVLRNEEWTARVRDPGDLVYVRLTNNGKTSKWCITKYGTLPAARVLSAG